MKRALKGIEALLYLLFVLDCLVLVAGTARQANYDPSGGLGLIVLLLLAAVAHRARCGRSY